MSDKVTYTKLFALERGLNIPDGLSNSAFFERVAEQVNQTPQELTNTLWNMYNPSRIWMVMLSIGLAATFCLFLYDKFLMKDEAPSATKETETTTA